MCVYMCIHVCLHVAVSVCFMCVCLSMVVCVSLWVCGDFCGGLMLFLAAVKVSTMDSSKVKKTNNKQTN